MAEPTSVLSDFYKLRADSLIERVDAARDHLTDEHIRRVRVGIKRLRSLLRLMAYIRPKLFNSRRHERATRRLFKRAGRVRDYQVSQDTLSKVPLPADLSKRYRKYLEKEEQKARKQLKRALKKFSEKKLKKSGKLIGRLGLTVSPLKIEQRLRLFIDREAGAIEALQQVERSTEHTHEMRKHLKSLIEIGTLLAQFTHDDGLEQLLTKAKRTQVQIGTWHDRVVLLHHLEAFIAADDDLPDDTADRLIAKQQQLVDRQEKRIDHLAEQLTALLAGLAPWRTAPNKTS